MVTMTMLTGKFAGEVRDVTSFMDPQGLVFSAVRHGWQWEIDFSSATSEEKSVWGLADMLGRILLALQEGRSIWFQGVEYYAETDRSEDLLCATAQIEDAIGFSGMNVRVERDDEFGVVIATAGTEYSEQ